jgi:hypothetical protein
MEPASAHSSYLIAMAVGDIVKVDVSHRCAIWSEPSVVESAAADRRLFKGRGTIGRHGLCLGTIRLAVLASFLSVRWHGESMLDLCHSHTVDGRPFVGRRCGSRDCPFVDW